MKKLTLALMLNLVATVALFSTLAAAEESHVFTAKQTEHGATVTVDGKPFAEYVIDQANKPYLFPVYGPTGKLMTREFPMRKVEGEQQDHPHHRGICFGHEDINGSDSWTERATFDRGEKTNDGQKKRIAELGRIKHVRFRDIQADSQRAVLTVENEFLGHDGKKSVTEIQTMTFRMDNGARIIDIDQEFIASEGDVKFGDRKDAGLSIRVPTAIALTTKKGGSIVNSEGKVDGATWGQRARWVDYHGPIGGEVLGIAFFNHPKSFRHPTSWHVREYGLFTANAFGSLDKNDPNGEHVLKKGEKMELHHRFVLHKGDEKAAQIEAAYEKYANEKKGS